MEDWHEFQFDQNDENTLPSPPKKSRFLADQNVPKDIIIDLKDYGFSIKTVIEVGLSGHPDENINQYANRKKLILLTTDKDFWDERKHPINKCFGIICIDCGPQDFDKIMTSLALFYVNFLKFWPHDCWKNQKALLKTHGFVLRLISDQGKIEENEYQFSGSKILTRKIR